MSKPLAAACRPTSPPASQKQCRYALGGGSHKCCIARHSFCRAVHQGRGSSSTLATCLPVRGCAGTTPLCSAQDTAAAWSGMHPASLSIVPVVTRPQLLLLLLLSFMSDAERLLHVPWLTCGALPCCSQRAIVEADDEVKQAMKGFIHNL
jgi:hypothetical protein